MGCKDVELSILFTDDEHMAELNRHYLGKTGPTNVLAFPMSSGPLPEVQTGMLGDVIVSVDRAMEEAKSFDETFEGRLYHLLIHGILHLLDYDHERSEKDAELMEMKEQELLDLVVLGERIWHV
ncbi:MAG: rRNA maturation RNase YbeY [Pseudomonadota bacterium]